MPVASHQKMLHRVESPFACSQNSLRTRASHWLHSCSLCNQLVVLWPMRSQQWRIPPLQDVLADRKTGGRTTGEQRMNGDPKRRASLARVMGYVEQVRPLFTWAGVPASLQIIQIGCV